MNEKSPSCESAGKGVLGLINHVRGFIGLPAISTYSHLELDVMEIVNQGTHVSIPFARTVAGNPFLTQGLDLNWSMAQIARYDKASKLLYIVHPNSKGLDNPKELIFDQVTNSYIRRNPENPVELIVPLDTFSKWKKQARQLRPSV